MEKSFYDITSSSTMLREGSYLTVQRSLNYRGERADFTPFLDVPLKELEQRLKVSKAEERKIYDQLQEAAKAWDEHGAQTLLLQKAIEYLKVPEVQHTANEWKQKKDGSWEISNLVYKMTFSIVRCGDEWKLSWELSYTAPGLSVGYWEYTRSPRQRIEYEGSKKYKTLEGAQKYIQNKFDQYADRFETLSPRIPKEAKPLFSVNGQLLQGYGIMRQVKKEGISLEDLMAQLEASFPVENAPEQGGMDHTEAAQEQEEPVATEAPQEGAPAAPTEAPPPTLTVITPGPQAAAPKQPPAKATQPGHKKRPLHKKRLAMAR